MNLSIVVGLDLELFLEQIIDVSVMMFQNEIGQVKSIYEECLTIIAGIDYSPISKYGIELSPF